MRRTTGRSLLAGALIAVALLLCGGAPSALGAAQAAGEEVPGFENEHTKVFANADGSYTAEVHTVPINFRNAQGNWQTIDPTLVSAPGGWKNTAGPFNVSFANSVAAPTGDLVTISDGSSSLGFGAASPSPLAGAPIVFGNTISYANVYPGISLLYTLERNELKEEVVLTQKPTIAPSLRFPLSLTGLTATKQPNGEISLQDAKGKAVFTIPRLTMVDSAGPVSSKEGAKTDAIDYALSTVAGKQTLSITPDWNWLRDGARVYPVYVDPIISLTPSTGTFIRSNLSTPQSGATTYEVGSSNGGATIARALVTFNLSSLQGVTVSSANVSAWESWSQSCTASLVSTYQVTSSWTGSVIWSTQPSVASSAIESALAAQGFSGSCPAKRITLADVTGAVQNWLSGTWQNYGLEVKAASETDSNGFKKFANDFSLQVVYNVTLAVPTNLLPSDGTISTSTTPLLSGVWPGSGSGYVEFEIRRASDGAIVVTGNGSPVSQGGQTSSWTVPSGKLVSGNAYSWRARSRTGSGSDASAWSASRTYSADQTPFVAVHSPTTGAVIDSLNPLLRATASDADGNPLYLQFQVSSNAGFTNIVADSGWMPTTWTYTVPDDALHNDIRSDTGVTFYWRTRAKDTLGATAGWAASDFTLKLSLIGVGDNWPTFTRGPISMNEATGNLVTEAPGPSYPTVVGAMGMAPAYNSFNDADIGLGPGWTLGIVDLRGTATKLINHAGLSGTQKQDTVELVRTHGGSRWFRHVVDSAVYLPPHGETGALVTKNDDGTWTLTDLDGTIASYGVTQGNGVSRLTKVEYADVQAGIGAITYSFVSGSNDKLQTITDPAGRTLTLTWHSANPSGCPSPALLCVTGPDGVTWKYWDSGGRLSGVWNGTRDLVAYTYGNGRLTQVKNANDLNPSGASPGYDGTHSLQISYDGDHRVTSVSDGPIHSQPVGQQTSTWSFAYHGQTNLLATRAAHAGLPQGTVRQSSGDTVITPPKQQGLPSPKTTTVYYDGLGQPLQVTDILGSVTMSAYDSRGSLLWREDADGNPTDNTWDSVNDLLLETQGPDPDGAGSLGRRTVDYRYDEMAAGNALQPGAGLQGLQASYFPNLNVAGRPAARQTDAIVDFSWGTGGPAPLGTQTDTFSVRWSGNLNVTTEGDYTFTTISDEGVRLNVEGMGAIHKWLDQTVTSLSSLPIHLTAGLHPITLDYYEKTGPAEVHLQWSCLSCSPTIPEQVIPASSLQPAWGNETSTVSAAGRLSFSHFLEPEERHADYELMKLSGGTNVITSYGYDTYGRVTQKVAPRGNAARTIDGQGNLTGSPDAAYATNYTYYAPGESAAKPAFCGGGSAIGQAQQLKQEAPPGITATTLVYDSAGRLVAKTDGAGTSCSTYSSEGRMTSAKDGRGNTTSHAYDPAGNLRTVTAPDGSTTSTAYDESDAVTSKTDANSRVTSFFYDADGNVTQRTAPLSRTTTYAYDDAGNKTSSTNPLGKTTAYVYDALNRLTSTTTPLGKTSTTTYDKLSSVIAHTDPRNKTTTYAYDADGKQTGVTDPLGKTTSYAYDALGRQTTVTDANNHTTSYGYDLDSNRTSVTAPDSGVTTLVYNTGGRLTSKTDPLGHATSYGYDSAGRQTSTTAPTGEMTSAVYDAVGNRTSSTDAAGKTTTYTYNSVNRLTQITTPLGHQTNFAYDPAGNQTSKTDPLNHTTTFAYDAADRLVTVTDPLGKQTTSAYDAADRLTSRTDAKNHAASYGYDNDNRLTTITAPDNGVTTLAYDDAGNVTSRTDALNRTTTFTYDGLNRPLTKTGPLNRMWSYTYDNVGNRIKVVDAKGNATPDPTDGTTTYGYDAADRIASIDYSDATQDASFSYDLAGRRTQLTDGAGTQSYGYDNSDRLTGVTRGANSFAYTYDSAGRLSSRTYPDASLTSYTYDDKSRLATATVGTATTSFVYDAADRLTATGFPNGWAEQRSYDNADRISDIRSVNGAQTLAVATYTRDNVGNPTQIVRDSVVETYAYDANDRLTDACYGGPIAGCSAGSLITYSYNAVGNRLAQVKFGTTTTYSYDVADQLTQKDTGGVITSYANDANGNQTQAGTKTLIYDQANRLTQVQDGASSVTFGYDGLGNRLSKTASGQTTNYLWDENNPLPQLALEKDSSTVVRSYAYGHELLSIGAGGGRHYLHHDDLGTTSAITNQTGSIQWRYTYDPYGVARTTTKVDPSAPDNVMQFTGQQLDADTGLYNLRARHYDPTLGRFLSTDPVGPGPTDPSFSPYAYVDGRPTVATDPSGMVTVFGDGGGEFTEEECETPEGADYCVPVPQLDESSDLAEDDPADGAGEAAMRVAAASTADPALRGCKTSTLRQREDCAYRFLVSKLRSEGVDQPELVAAAIMGNLWVEAGESERGRWLDPTTVQDWSITAGYCRDLPEFTPGCGIGIGQWTTETRQNALIDFAGSSEAALDFKTQLRYLWSELKDQTELLPRPDTLNWLEEQVNLRSATYVFMRGFENPAGGPLSATNLNYGLLRDRVQRACVYYERYTRARTCP